MIDLVLFQATIPYILFARGKSSFIFQLTPSSATPNWGPNSELDVMDWTEVEQERRVTARGWLQRSGRRDGSWTRSPAVSIRQGLNRGSQEQIKPHGPRLEPDWSWQYFLVMVKM